MRSQKFNKYAPTIDAEIDLHGMTSYEAIASLKDFFNEATKQSQKKVRVITGKGLHSPDGRAIIREAVISFLREKGWNYTQAKMNDGGEGALIVSL